MRIGACLCGVLLCAAAAPFGRGESVSPILLSRSHPFILDVSIEGGTCDWRITDRSRYPVREGYEYWYLVNSDLVRSSTPLNGYRYESDAPVRIHKQIFKKGSPFMAWWITDGSWTEGAWGDPNASYIVDRGDLGGAAYYMFKRDTPAPAAPGRLNWIDPIPREWTPGLVSTWPDRSPEFSLPDGSMYVHTPHAQGQTIAQTFKKGVTHYSHRWRNDEPDLPEDRLYNDVPQIRALFNLQPPYAPPRLTEEEARRRGREVFLPHLWIGETQEGTDFLPADDPTWAHFYDEVIQRMEARKARDGRPYYIAHNYYSSMGPAFSFVNKKVEDLDFIYRQPPEEWPAHPLPETIRDTCNLHVVGWYKNPPDNRDFTYQQIYHMEVARRLGLTSGVFLFPVYEYPPGFSNQIDLSSPAGRFSRSDKAPLSPSELLSAPFLAFEYGNLYVVWDTDYKRSDDPRDIHRSEFKGGSDLWEPDPGAPAEFPYAHGPGQGFPATYAQWVYDMTHWGVLLYARTAILAGGRREYAAFRLDDGPWIEPQTDGSDVLHAWREQRGIATVRDNGDALCVWYLNPYADNRPHSIEIRHPSNPSLTWTGVVSGDGIHVATMHN